MSNKVLFIVGAPGVGKTSLVREFLDPFNMYLHPKPKWTVAPDLVCAGHYGGGTFDGADTVPYNGVAEALQFWKASLCTMPLTIFDGDRFSHGRALDFFKEKSPQTDIFCVHLTGSEDTLKAHREERGSNQNPSWMAGRATKARNFAKLVENYGKTVDIEVDNKSAAQIASEVRTFLGV